MTQGHIPVMLQEVLQVLDPKPGKRFLDCTFGAGGHTQALLNAAEDVQVVALDCDPDAGTRAAALKTQYPERFRFYDTNFSSLDALEETGFDGILMDLGISSFHVDQASRGFSFNKEAELDMRMDPRAGVPASAFLESATREELVRAVRDYGEEHAWKRVITAIQSARGTGALARTRSLAQLVEHAVGGRPGRIHRATKTFQGIRIAVNQELDALEQALPKAIDKLAEGGVFAVISFHSLEDRLVKRFFRRMAGKPEHARDHLPQDMRTRLGTLVSSRAIKPSPEEIAANPRSRSSKLRAFKKETPLLP